MRNKNSWTRKTGVAVTAAVCGALAFGALPAQAAGELTTSAVSARGQFGPVRDLAVEVTRPAAGYNVDATWSALSGAVSYNVALLRADGTVVQNASVTRAAWSVSTTEKAGSQLRLRVVGVDARKRKSKAATVPVNLPDLTAPTATFAVSSVDEVGMIKQLSLSDDLSDASQISRWVNWGEGFVPWDSGDSVTHSFPKELAAYHPQVKVADEAGNDRTYTLTVVIMDKVAPQGQYAVTPGTVWTEPGEQVTLTQTQLTDNFSASADISRSVDWRDGSAPEIWTGDGALAHTYTAAGTYKPVVQLTDQAGNGAPGEVIGEVVVKADAVAPGVTVRVPRKAVTRVATWRTVRGTAADVDGTGVSKVELRAVQKRGRVWYAYKGPRKVWVTAGATKAAAISKARPAFVAPTEQGTWSHAFGSLRKGTLVVTARSHDRAGNISQPAQVQPRLTRR